MAAIGSCAGTVAGMDTYRVGRVSLRLDAAYCALAAALVLAFAGPLAGLFAVPVWVVVAVAAGTAGWAGALWHAAGRAEVRPWLAGVLAANVAAAGVIAALAVSRPHDAFALLLAAVSVEVAAFAVSQAVALRRPTPN
jgi:hypothetical protein